MNLPLVTLRMLDELNAVCFSLMRFYCHWALWHIFLKKTHKSFWVLNSLTKNWFFTLHEICIWVFKSLLFKSCLTRFILATVPRIIIWQVRISLRIDSHRILLGGYLWRNITIWWVIIKLICRFLVRWLCRLLVYILQSIWIYEFILLQFLY